MKVKLHYTNLDNFMDTRQQATVSMDIEADDLAHAYMLAAHLQRMMQADYYTIEE